MKHLRTALFVSPGVFCRLLDFDLKTGIKPTSQVVFQNRSENPWLFGRGSDPANSDLI